MSRSCRRKRTDGPRPASDRGRRVPGLLLALTLAAGWLAGGTAEPPGGIAIKNTTGSGLTWIFRKDASSALTCVILLVKGGTGADPAGKAGLSYLATRNAIDIPDEGKVRDIMVQSTRLTVSGLEDATLVSIQCLSENLEDALRTATRILKDPLISGFRIDIIKENMRHQGKAELDDSLRAGRAEAKKALFGPAGYGGPVWGTEETLKAIRKKDVQDYYKSRFTAANMILSVSSDLEEADVRPLVAKYFAGFPAGSPIEDVQAPPKVPDERSVVVAKDAKQTYLGLHFPLPPMNARSYAMACLAEDMLGSGVGSVLWPLRSRERLAYTVDGFLSYARGGGVLSAYLETSPEKLGRARESLTRIVRDLGAGTITEEDLRIARLSAGAAFLRTNEIKEVRTRTVLLFEARGLGCDYAEKFPAELAAVGLDEMNAFLRETLSLDRAVEVVIGPSAGGSK